jgi:tyrosyl-tRNA synthetase
MSALGLTALAQTEGLEVIGPDRELCGARVMLGVAPVPPLHLGYDRSLRLLAALRAQGAKIVVLIADLHASLAYGLSAAEGRRRKRYYYSYFEQLLGSDVEFIDGSAFQTNQGYVEELFRWQRTATVSEMKGSMPRAVTQQNHIDGATVAPYTYTLMQVVDPVFLGCDLVLSDRGQAKIYDLGPRLSERLVGTPSLSVLNGGAAQPYPTQLYFELPRDLRGRAMNESTARTRISIHETPETLTEKIRALHAPPPPRNDETPVGNGMLELFRDSVFPWLRHPVFLIRADGRLTSYSCADVLAADYQAGLVDLHTCKTALCEALLERLRIAQTGLGSTQVGWIDLARAI